MRTTKIHRFIAVALVLTSVSGVALAEVSVLRGRDGRFVRFFNLTQDNARRSPVIWGQVRPYLTPDLMLNPLGDTTGDLAPVIGADPGTKRPWVFWPRNVGNIKQLVYATWTDAGWTVPAPIVTEARLIPYDELDPSVAFAAAGAPYLVWWTAEPVPQVYFSILARGTWTPPLRISDPDVASSRPRIVFERGRVVIDYTTPSGRVSRTFESAFLADSAMNRMDTPIPPGLVPTPSPTTSPEPTGPRETDIFFRR